MLIADAEGFWKTPNVFDVFGGIGVILGVASIWVSWWLAKRDLQKRLDEAAERASRAARDEVRRVAQAVLHTGVADAARFLALTREAWRAKAWPRAGELCELAREQLAGVVAQPAASAEIQVVLRGVSVVLLECVTELRRRREPGAGKMPEEALQRLEESILALRQVEGRMTGIRAEGDHGQ